MKISLELHEWPQYLALPYFIVCVLSACSGSSGPPSAAEVKRALGGESVTDLVIKEASKVGKAGANKTNCMSGFEEAKDKYAIELTYAADLGACGKGKLANWTCGKTYWSGTLCVEKNEKGEWVKLASSNLSPGAAPAGK